jgi:nitroreductase
MVSSNAGTETKTSATGEMRVLEAIHSRRSIGRVRPERPPRAVIEEIIEAGTWAPNHRLTEPWRFIVLAGQAREALGREMAALLPAGAPEADVAKERAKPLRAPVVIAVAVEPAIGPKIVEMEEVTAGAAAIQNMLLAAHAHGLAAQWRTGNAAYSPQIKAHLGLPEAAHLLGFVYVGYADGPAPTMRRHPAASLTRWEGWEE